MSTAPELEARLEQLQAARRTVLMDLSELEFMDSTGLGIMTRAINSSRSDGWVFVIEPELAPQVRSLFRLTAVDQFAGIDGTDSPSE